MKSEFGDRVRDAMLAAGIETPQQLAKTCGVPVARVRKWLTLPEPDLMGTDLLKLADRLRVRMRWLASGEGVVPMPPHLNRAVEILERLGPERALEWIKDGERMAKD